MDGKNGDCMPRVMMNNDLPPLHLRTKNRLAIRGQDRCGFGVRDVRDTHDDT